GVITATADVLVVYLQQFWKTVKQVPNANKSICFIIDRNEITYNVDMFRATVKLPMETPDNPFIALATIKYIQPFMQIVGYQRDVDKENYTEHDQRKIKLHLDLLRRGSTWSMLTMFSLFIMGLSHCFKKKDVIQYARFTKLIIADLMEKFDFITKRLEEDYHSIKFIIDDIRAIEEYKEYVQVFVGVDV
ncbi:hypothetical protein Tco_1270570, partial [Tanacetum coccineum]